MEIQFKDYRFCQAQQILYCNEEIIPLKRNQAVLLDFFLASPDAIHSKDTILDAVWQGRVVSEQVVFQTISQLRVIFGNDAIQTFPKKGYKWQIPFIQNRVDSAATQNALKQQDSSLDSGAGQSEYRRKTRLLFLAIAALIIALPLLYFLPKVNSTQTAIHLVTGDKQITPSRNLFNQIAQQALSLSEEIRFLKKQVDHPTRQLFAAPKLIWQQANVDPSDWLVWGDTYASDDGVFLHYGLSRHQTQWQGYLFAENEAKLHRVFQQRLKSLSRMGLFSSPDERLTLNTLLTMAKVSPDDPDLLLQVSNYYIDTQQLDIALTYLQKLSKQNSSYATRPYQALAQLQIGKIYKMRGQHIQAVNSLDAMADILFDTPIWPLTFHYIKTKAWLAYDKTEFDAMFSILEQGLTLGRIQADPLSLFELHIMYSILAKKVSEPTKMYAHLNEAQALLLKHNLDDSNLAVVYYHFALFTQDNSKAIPYLERILTLPRTVQNYWVHDDASELLVSHHIENKDYSKAHSLIAPASRSPKKLVLKARILRSENKLAEAKSALEQAFELARLDYDTKASIDAALILYRLTSSQPKVQAEYFAYLQSNANPDWLKQRDIVLTNRQSQN